MKKFTKTMKGKKVLSLVLAALMLVTTFSVAVPMLKLGASAADITIDGVSQTQIVTDGNETANLNTNKYDEYAANYLGGAGYSTGIVIPGLDPAQDYVIQGMTYYPARDWFLVTAYHNVADGETTQSSKVFALDAATGEFVAMFSFLNPDGTTNTDHGGGITVSEHNLYYSCGDKDRSIAYAPLSALEAAPLNAHTQIQLVDKLEFVEVGSVKYDSKTAYSAYVCYDQGILWMGNFYDMGAKLLGVTIAAADYNAPSNNTYNSMVFGYKLAGNSSAEEWAHLKGTFKNLMKVTTASGSGTANGSTHTWNAYQNGTNINIAGTITAPTAYVGEYTGSFGSFALTEGLNYTIEFKSTNRNTDMYMFSPAGTHCNVKQSTQTTITQLEDGRYHYVMNFTAGLKPTNADSTWPTTLSTDGSYTGDYTIRFDQDAIQTGEAREYAITDVKISQTNTYENAESVVDEGYAGSPSYAIGLNNAIKDVQYATVDNGKLYLSRSYGSGAGNSIRFGFGETSFLTVADIDLSVPGTKEITISTAETDGLDKKIMAYDISSYKDYPMMPMSEGICIVGDEMFITFEGASNKYLNESSGTTSIGNCEKPVDVIWQLNPHDLMNVEVAEPEKSIYYEKVTSMAEIENGKEYIIVHQSTEKDPVTQEQILYALNTNGNFKDYKLSKSSGSEVKGYNGMIGHAITDYDLVDENNDGSSEKLYLNDPDKDDIEAVRWTISNISGNAYKFTTTDPYFANCNNLYFDEDQISMAPAGAGYLSKMKMLESGNGKGGFWLSNEETHFLWCNDGVNENYNTKINSYYIKNSGTTAIYSGIYEQPGTFHCDALNSSGSNIISESVPTDGSYKDGVFYIFKRVVDETASTYESRVHTDLSAELQEDGTYTVELETYAISPNHYKYVGEKPTDYIIVADTSSSMATAGSTGIASYNSALSVISLSVEANTSDDNGEGVNGYAFSNPAEDIYYKHTDGNYYKIYLAVNTVTIDKIIGFISNFDQRYWAYYVASDGLYYVLKYNDGNSSVSAGITESQFKYNVDNELEYSAKSEETTNDKRRTQAVYTGTHYRFDDVSSSYTTQHIRIDTLKNATSNLIGQIAAENSQNRIALVQYGGSSGFYNTGSSLSTDDYANALWYANATNAEALQNIAKNLTTADLTSNEEIAFTHVNNIIANSDATYMGENKDRNVAVIYLSDGVAGADDQSATKTVANEIINGALTAKKAGAFIYTVMIGADGTTFDRNLFMEAVSSKYAEAKSMDELGGQSIDGINYALTLATTDIYNFLNFGDVALKEISANNAVSLDSLDANAYIREQLSEAFKFPGNTSHYDVKVDLVPGVFDKIGRFTFDEDNVAPQSNLDDDNDTDVDWDVDTANRTIIVENYNYAEQYIGKNRKDSEGKELNGNKLRITITGLLVNEDEKIQNTSINDTTTTGIYKNETYMNANDAFKYVPTEYFNIPEYTYVLDYDLPMYDSDVNGTLKSVDGTPARQRDADGNLDYDTERSTADVKLTFKNDAQDMTYELNSGVYTTDDNTSYCLIQRDNGSYDWFKLNIIPASNVLFEETRFTSVEKANTAKWSTEGTAINTYQSLSDENDRYGYDETYANNGAGHSNGTAYKATVNSSTKRSETMQFQYTGTGFDLMSACGENTGILMVSVRNSEGTLEKLLLVDTYYKDANSSYTDSDGLLKQVPVVSYTNAGGYDTYSVDVAGAYMSNAQGVTGGRSVSSNPLLGGLLNSFSTKAEGYTVETLLEEFDIDIPADEVELIWFDDNSVLNGGTGPASAGSKARSTSTTSTSVSLDCYVDGIRTYDPLQDQSHYIDSEKGAQYYNIVDELAYGEGTTITSVNGNGLFAYVTGTLEADDEGNIPTLSFANYQSVGPQHELYLEKATGADGSHAVSFNVTVPTSDARVMISLRAVDGATTAKVASGSEAIEFPINTATEQYFDITPYLTIDTATGIANVIITNIGDGLLSVNNLKLVDATAAAISDEDLPVMAMSLRAEPVTIDNPNSYDYNAPVEDDVQEPEADTPAEDDTPEADEPEATTPMDLASLIKMLIEFIQSIIVKFF